MMSVAPPRATADNPGLRSPPGDPERCTPRHSPRLCSRLRDEYTGALATAIGLTPAMRKTAAPMHDFSLCAERRRQETLQLPVCAHGACGRPGRHRAPNGPGNWGEPQWYCREHARERNLNWDYFHRMSSAEIEEARRSAIVWDRPTWPAAQAAGGARSNGKHADSRAAGASENRAGVQKRSESHRRALAILGLQAAATPGDIRNRFRKLLRLLHPDLNAGKHVDATRLRAVIWAWRELRPASTTQPQ